MQKGLPIRATPFMPARESALGFHPWIALSSNPSFPSLRTPPWIIQQKKLTGFATNRRVCGHDIYDPVTLFREAARQGVLIVADHPTFHQPGSHFRVAAEIAGSSSEK